MKEKPILEKVKARITKSIPYWICYTLFVIGVCAALVVVEIIAGPQWDEDDDGHILRRT